MTTRSVPLIPPTWYRSLWEDLHIEALGLWGWLGLLGMAGLLLALIHLLIWRRSYFSESKDLEYSHGYPGVEGPLLGEPELDGATLRFRALWQPSKIHFEIPLDQIMEVKTGWDSLRVLSYWRIGGFALLGERNRLILRVRDAQGTEHTVEFAAHRHSSAPRFWHRCLHNALKGDTLSWAVKVRGAERSP